MQQFDQMQRLGKDNVDAALKSFGVASQSAQTIAAETADYAKRSFEQGAATLEKLVGAKTLDKAVEIHTDYMRSAYQTFVAQSTKMGEVYANAAKEALKPFEGMMTAPASAAR